MKMKYKILITTNFSFLNFKKNFNKNLICSYLPSINKGSLINKLKTMDGWICSPTPKYKINKEILIVAKNLKCIVTPSTGTNHIDLKLCKKLNIKVISLSNTNFVNKIYASSEFTFLLALITLKKFMTGIKEANNYNWRTNENLFRGYELYGKKVAIIGYGRIGKNLCKYLRPFGAKLFVHDIKKIRTPKYVKYCNSINEVLNASKIIFICVKLNESTLGMINKDIFKLMDKTAILINTSRGEVINEKALLDSLKKNNIQAAAVDVVKDEHKIKKSNKNKLIEYAKKNNNLIITPHMAGVSYDSETKAGLFAIDKINNFFK